MRKNNLCYNKTNCTFTTASLVKSSKVMKKEITINGYGTGHFKRLEGKLMTLLESLGLKETQEKAIKDLVRGEIWHMWEHSSFSENKVIENPTAVEENSDNDVIESIDIGDDKIAEIRPVRS